MIKKINKLMWGILLVICMFGVNVYAIENDDIYYVNQNGVSFTKEEYDFVGKLYFDGYQESMTVENYQRLKDIDVMGKEVKNVEYEEGGIQPYTDVSYQSPSKKLVMSYACGTICSATLKASWLTIANVRSYDLIGIYSPNSNSLTYAGALMRYSGKDYSPVETNKTANGMSATFKLPTTDAKYVFIIDFIASKGTKVYGSYQHAKKTVSLANSRKYTFASSGYGGVFKFDSSVSSYYDAMGGVVATIK